MSSCPCFVCRNGNVPVETLEWYMSYHAKMTKLTQRLHEGKIKAFRYQDKLIDIDHEGVQVAKAVLQYGEGKCLYRMYPRIIQLYYREVGPSTQSEEYLQQVLHEVLVSSDPIAYIDDSLQKYLGFA